MEECEGLGRQMVSIVSYFCNINGFMQIIRKNYSGRTIYLYLSNVRSWKIFTYLLLFWFLMFP